MNPLRIAQEKDRREKILRMQLSQIKEYNTSQRNFIERMDAEVRV